MKRFFFTIIGIVFCSVLAFAQVTVKAHLDSTSILVGSQTNLSITVNGVSEGTGIVFPSFKEEQEMAPGIEVVRTVDDTIGGCSRRTYVLTAWDEGKYNVPALDVKVNGKKFSTNSIPLQVNTIKVDTAHADSIRPMHDIAGQPYEWSEWSPLFWLSLLVLVLLVVIYYLYSRLRAGKPVLSRMKFIRKLLPHEKALQKIEKIKSKHLSASTDQKEYYTELTDILRQYLEDRFGIKAKEMTSSEIIYRLEKEKKEDGSMVEELREVFQTADLVKFAKYSVQDNINDTYLNSVVQFIDSTKEENAPTVEKVGSKLSEKDRNKMRRRKGVRASIAVLVFTVAAIIAYVVWRAIELLS